MNKKQIIQLVVIIAAFGGAFFVLYKGGLFGGNTPAIPVTPQSAAATTQSVLPYGDSLNFTSVINPSRFQYNIVQYPQVSPQNDVGVPVNNLVAPSAISP